MKFVEAFICLDLCSTSCPLISGSIRSSMTRSKSQAFSRFRASMPEEAVSTSNPSAASMSVQHVLLSLLSSTMSNLPLDIYLLDLKDKGYYYTIWSASQRERALFKVLMNL